MCCQLEKETVMLEMASAPGGSRPTITLCSVSPLIAAMPAESDAAGPEETLTDSDGAWGGAGGGTGSASVTVLPGRMTAHCGALAMTES